MRKIMRDVQDRRLLETDLAEQALSRIDNDDMSVAFALFML
jgi:hypothetical protein